MHRSFFVSFPTRRQAGLDAPHPKTFRRLAAALLLAGCLQPALARAGESDPSPNGEEAASPDFSASLTGDWGGLRTALADRGANLSLKYTGEIFNVPSGGLHRGTVYEDQFLAAVDFDLKKLAGIAGATAHVSGMSVHGRGPTHDLVGNNLDISSIEIPDQRQSRLWTAWYQQSFAGGAFSVRAGQLAIDDEFLISPTAGNLINATFGINASVFDNLSGVHKGGPIYPLGAPGIRVQVNPGEDLAWLTAVFSSIPESPDRGGANFRWDGGAYVISELQYLRNQGKDAAGLPGVYKLGGWYDTGKFDDLHFDRTGQSLAAGGEPKQHRGQGALYAIADQTVWREEEGPQTVNLFLRAGLAPDEAISSVPYYVDGGIGWKGLVPGREDDVLTFGVAYTGVSGETRALARDNHTAIPDYEIALELDYAAQVTPWWTVQPDIQYIIHPGLGGPNPLTASPTSTIPDATVLGVRTTVNF